MLSRDTIRNVVFEKLFHRGLFDWPGSCGLDFRFGPTLACESLARLFWHFAYTFIIVR